MNYRERDDATETEGGRKKRKRYKISPSHLKNFGPFANVRPVDQNATVESTRALQRGIQEVLSVGAFGKTTKAQ